MSPERFIFVSIDICFVVLTNWYVFSENRSKRDLVSMLVEKGYSSDPVKAWKKSISKDDVLDDGSEEGSSVASSEAAGPDFNYILNMNLWSLSKEKKEALLAERDTKVRFILASVFPRFLERFLLPYIPHMKCYDIAQYNDFSSVAKAHCFAQCDDSHSIWCCSQ